MSKPCLCMYVYALCIKHNILNSTGISYLSDVIKMRISLEFHKALILLR